MEHQSEENKEELKGWKKLFIKSVSIIHTFEYIIQTRQVIRKLSSRCKISK